MDPGRVVFDSGLARLAAPGAGAGGAQMLLFGGSVNGGGFFRGLERISSSTSSSS